MGSKKKKHDKQNDEVKQQTTEITGNKVPSMSRERLIWITLSGILFVISILMFLYTFSLKTEVSNLDENLVNCSIELDALIENGKQSANRLNKLEKDLKETRMGAASEFFLPEKYAREFERKGLTRPIEEIKTSLIINTADVIPYDATDGTKMRFYNRNQIYVISPNRVFANFGDSKNYGWLYLEYTVGNEKRIAWKIIESYCTYYDK